MDMLDHYGDMVYRVAMTHSRTREDAEDAAQEAFFAYARKQPDFHDAEHAKAWFLRVTLRYCAKIRNSAYHRHTVPSENTLASGPPENGDVTLALLSLKPEFRTPVYLFYYEQMSVRQIARILSLSEAAVKKRLERARARLRDIMGGDLDE